MPEADAMSALRRKLQIRTPTTLLLVSPLASRELTGAVSMGDRPHATDNALDQTDQELLIFTVSGEALEKAAGGTSWAQTYPQTCVATICVREIVVGAD
jgi:hypothetical protein